MSTAFFARLYHPHSDTAQVGCQFWSSPEGLADLELSTSHPKADSDTDVFFAAVFRAIERRAPARGDDESGGPCTGNVTAFANAPMGSVSAWFRTAATPSCIGASACRFAAVSRMPDPLLVTP